MARVELHLRIRVEPGNLPALLAFLREAVPFYERPGGVRTRLLRDAAGGGRLIEVIEYASEAGYRRDQERVEKDPEMKAYLARWRALLAEAPVVEVYRDESGAIRPDGRDAGVER